MLKIVLWVLLILTVFVVIGMVTDKKEKHSIKELLIAIVVGLVLIFFIFHKSQPSDTSAKDSSSKATSVKSSSSSDNSSSAESSSSAAAALSSYYEAKKQSDAAEKEPTQYQTGITYEQIARTPDDFKGKKMQFTGKVIQVIEGKSETQLRLAVNGDSNNVILIGFDPDILNGSRILEDDLITASGTSIGTVSYDSTLGGKITIPAMVAKIISDQGKAPDNYGY